MKVFTFIVCSKNVTGEIIFQICQLPHWAPVQVTTVPWIPAPSWQVSASSLANLQSIL